MKVIPMELTARYAFATETCKLAGELALRYFRESDSLKIDQKGAQDWVSEADRNVEHLIREQIAASFPEDGIVGEEHGRADGTSGLVWVIDPIDGTANFVNGIPTWCVVLAGVADGKTQIAVIHDPVHDETFTALRGNGAMLNGAPMSVASGKGFDQGTTAVGFSGGDDIDNIARLVKSVLTSGGMMIRNASGAISLAYVAAGRYIAFVEEHMHAWDCLAGQLLIEEAGGIVEDQNADQMIETGGRVLAGTSDTFDVIKTLAAKAWQS